MEHLGALCLPWHAQQGIEQLIFYGEGSLDMVCLLACFLVCLPGNRTTHFFGTGE
jgi:hypothetical protein